MFIESEQALAEATSVERGMMTHVERIANFATGASPDSLSSRARDQVKNRILASLGCAIDALNGEPFRKLGASLAARECAGHLAPT